MKPANLVDGPVASEEVLEVAGVSSGGAEVEEVEATVATEATVVTEATVAAIEAMVVGIEDMAVEREVMAEVIDPTVVVDTPTGVADTLVAAVVDTGITGTRGDMTVLVDPTETVMTAMTDSLDVLYLKIRVERDNLCDEMTSFSWQRHKDLMEIPAVQSLPKESRESVKMLAKDEQPIFHLD